MLLASWSSLCIFFCDVCLTTRYPEYRFTSDDVTRRQAKAVTYRYNGPQRVLATGRTIVEFIDYTPDLDELYRLSLSSYINDHTCKHITTTIY